MPEIEMTIDAASGQIQSVQIQGMRGPHHGIIPQHLGDLLGKPAEETNTPEYYQTVTRRVTRRGGR
jgi:hypothetical protein